MSIKNILKHSFQLFLLTIILFISLAVSSALFGVASSSKSSADAVLPVLIYSFANTAVMSLFICNAKVKGIKLIAVSSLILFGIQYFMTQIETLFFNSAVNMPIGQILKVVASGALSSIIFCIMAALIYGRLKKGASETSVKFSAIGILYALCILSAVYVVIYFLFGYFVAWQFSVLRIYYSGSTGIDNFFVHMANTIKSNIWLPVFQIFRGFLWGGLALAVTSSLNMKSRLTYIISALLFGVLITSPLIMPNAYMPAGVRFGHSIELLSSMITFGIAAVFVIKRFKAIFE